MRIRKKKWAVPELEASNFFIKEPTQYKGKWKQIFGNDNPIEIELGCGRGKFISKLAKTHPEKNYIGIDLISDMLGYAKRNIETEYGNNQINNIKLIAYNIELITDIFNKTDEISRIFITFCNPWPRPRHKKRRLTHTKQLEKYSTFLKKEGEIFFKTDDNGLFEDSIKYFQESGFNILKKTYDLHSENDINNIETEHERMFSNQGIKIKALIAKMSKGDVS